MLSTHPQTLAMQHTVSADYGCLTWCSRACLGAAACGHCPAAWDSIIPHITTWNYNKNSKFKLWFLLNVYCFCTTVKLKNCKFNHPKLGTVCIGNYFNLHSGTFNKGPLWITNVYKSWSFTGSYNKPIAQSDWNQYHSPLELGLNKLVQRMRRYKAWRHEFWSH